MLLSELVILCIKYIKTLVFTPSIKKKKKSRGETKGDKESVNLQFHPTIL